MLAPSPEITVEDPFVALERVTVTYGQSASRQVKALDETDLKLAKGDFIALVGPSGCGKSTILKLVGGLSTREIARSFLTSARVSRLSR